MCHGLVSLLLTMTCVPTQALCSKADHDHFIVVFLPVTMTGFFGGIIVIYAPVTSVL